MKTRKKQLTTKDLIAQIELHKTAIGKHRDALRNLIDDADMVCSSVDEAELSLEDAVDKLSQYEF